MCSASNRGSPLRWGGSLLTWNCSYKIPFVSSAGAQGRLTHRNAGMTGLNWWEERPLPGSGGVTPAFLCREGPQPNPTVLGSDRLGGWPACSLSRQLSEYNTYTAGHTAEMHSSVSKERTEYYSIAFHVEYAICSSVGGRSGFFPVWDSYGKSERLFA